MPRRERCSWEGTANAQAGPHRTELALATGERAIADISPILHAIETDADERCVGCALRLPHGLAESCHAQHAPAISHDLVAGKGGARMEDFDLINTHIETRNHIALARSVG